MVKNVNKIVQSKKTELCFKMNVLTFLLFANFVGSIVSFEINEKDRPIIEEIHVPNLVKKRKVVLNCQILQGRQPIFIEWKVNGNAIKPSENVFYTNIDNDLSTLTIKSLNYENIANYSCLASNSYGSDEKTVNIRFKCRLILPRQKFFSETLLDSNNSPMIEF